MHNYFASGELENIKADNSLKYYDIISTVGLDGFIICKEFDFTEVQCADTE